MTEMLDKRLILTPEQRRILPEDAQQLYTDVYTQAWEQYDPGREGMPSRDTVASIAAMAAVTRLYDRNEETFRWYRKAEQPSAWPRKASSRGHSGHPRSVLGFLKGILGAHSLAQ